MSAPTDVVEPDELLYRKIPAKEPWYDPSSKFLHRHAFRISKERDTDGISVDRARSEKHPDFRTPQEAAVGGSAAYFIAVLRAGDVFAHGITVAPMPLPDNPGHAVLPQLCSATKKSDAAIELQQLLAQKLTIQVLGPFAGDS